MKTISRYIMTLALLLTAVTGAWADYTVTWEGTTLQGIAVKNNTATTSQTVEGITVTASNGEFFYNTDYPEGPVVIAKSSADNGLVFSAENNIKSIAITFTEIASYGGSMALGAGAYTYQVSPAAKSFALPKNDSFTGITKVVFTLEGDAPVAGPEVSGPTIVEGKPQWTFEMPGYDVVLTPIYAKAAAFATTGTEPDVKTLLPEAAEGVIADTDAPLIVEGTVAFAGTSTTVKQGTVMYAVTPATVTEAPALDAANKWSADVPTAKLVADGGIDVYVWYYIKGADTPQGQTATAENTFNDSEICTEPIKVTVLSNKFDIQFNAANANTIEAKATVTVGGAAATVTEGKLQGVKMGTEVKLKVNTGYKFRKVEVKKKAAAPPDPVTVTWNNLNFNSNPYTRDGVTLTTTNNAAMYGNFYDYGDKTFTNTIGKFTKIEIVCGDNNFDGWAKENKGVYQPDPEGPYFELFKLTWTGDAESVTIPGGNYLYDIQSITFYIQ